MRPATPAFAFSMFAVLFPSFGITSGGQEVEPELEVAFQLRPHDGVAGFLSGSLRLSPGEAEAEDRLIPLEDTTGVDVALPVGTRWQACAEIEGVWSPCALVNVTAGPEPIHQELELWPTGRLTGRIRMPDEETSLPEYLEVAFQTPHTVGPTASIAQSTRDCAVSSEGAWVCELPATTLDISLRVSGFVPHRLWGLEVPRGKEHKLAALTLQRGASLAAWVRLDSDTGDVSESPARLFPFVPHGPGISAAERAARTAAEAAVLENGFLQLGPVDGGTYVVEVTHPGFAPAQVFPLELGRGQETFLRDPIVLHPPLAIEIAVSPPADWLGDPWTVSLQRASQLSGSFSGGSGFRGVTTNGRVVVEKQSPGVFLLEILDSTGQSFFARPDVVVETAADASIHVELDLVTIHGELTLGDEPVEGTLWFGGRRGAPRVEIPSDADGEFAGVLPKSGWWPLEVEAPRHELSVKTRVEVRPDSDGEAFLPIELPDTELFGRVVDESGQPASGARVLLSHSLGSATTETDTTGAFSFRAFEAGPASLRAQARTPEGTASSQSVALPVAESVPLEPVELQLTRSRKIQGRVVSAGGVPVAGALVDLSTISPPSAALLRSARTDPEGAFTGEVHPEATMLRAVLSPPGYALQVQSVPPGDPLVLTASPEHGTLIVHLGPESLHEQSAPQRLVVLADGHELPTPRLRGWAQGHGVTWPADGTSLEVPRIAPGNYRACLARTDRLIQSALAEGDWRTGLERCDEGFLSQGGTLTLQVPITRDQDESSGP